MDSYHWSKEDLITECQYHEWHKAGMEGIAPQIIDVKLSEDDIDTIFCYINDDDDLNQYVVNRMRYWYDQLKKGELDV